MGEVIELTTMSGHRQDVQFMNIISIEQRSGGCHIKFHNRHPLSVKETREEVMELIAKCLGVSS